MEDEKGVGLGRVQMVEKDSVPVVEETGATWIPSSSARRRPPWCVTTIRVMILAGEGSVCEANTEPL